MYFSSNDVSLTAGFDRTDADVDFSFAGKGPLSTPSKQHQRVPERYLRECFCKIYTRCYRVVSRVVNYREQRWRACASPFHQGLLKTMFRRLKRRPSTNPFSLAWKTSSQLFKDVEHSRTEILFSRRGVLG